MKHIFLDNAATTATDPRVVEKMLPFFDDNFGNPSGIHYHCLRAKKALDDARKSVADILNCLPQEIIFTGGGTESDNLAIFGIAEKNANKNKNHLITSKIEHPAVLEPFKKLEKKGFNIDIVSPTKDGEITAEIFKKVIKKNTLFASFMYANNEIGTINDIRKLADIAHKNEVIFHTDACQAGGLLDLDVKKLGVDMMTLNGSKIYGPKGVGALFKKQNIQIEPQIIGGHQEFGLRAGTENVAGIVGFAEALKLATKEHAKEETRLRKIQEKIIDYIINNIDLARLNGSAKNRLSNNVNFSFLNVEGESLLLFINEAGFSVATGSACTSESLDPSHVLTGIGLPDEVAHGSIRITLGKNTKEKDIDNFLPVLKKSVERVRSMSPIHFTKKDFPSLF